MVPERRRWRLAWRVVGVIVAASEDDAACGPGYPHARFRLAEMDLQRRPAECRLSQLVGPPPVSSDQFEFGLLRTAVAAAAVRREFRP